MDSTMWPELPLDVLREISCRLGDTVDFVQFHAVCKPWRNSHDPIRTTRKQWILPPWLLVPDTKKTPLKLRCVFSGTSYRALPPFSVRRRNWVASADGTAAWHFAASPNPILRDLLTGAVTLLPPFPQENSLWKGSLSGIVYSDGTVLLYRISRHDDTTKFRAALLRPSTATWTFVKRTFRSHDLNVSYYHRKITITVGSPALTPEDEVGIVGDVLTVSKPWMPCELDEDYLYGDDYLYRGNYVLESRGELLCVSIYVSLDYPEAFGGKASVAGLVRALSLSVHVLEEDEATPGKIWCVRKGGGSLADRVLYLGWPNSFAVDASSRGDALSGGCAYFVYRDIYAMPNQPCAMFRYNLIDDKAKFVERLPEGWNNHFCMWLFPQPSIAPTEEITDRLEGQKWWKKKAHMAATQRNNIYIEMPQPQDNSNYFSLSVRNLPPKVDSFELQQFFSKHGKVSNAKVVSKRKNKMSKQIGLVTIEMVEERADALASLNGLVFNGCTLEVKLVRRWKGRRVPPAGSNQHSRSYLICIVLLIFLFVLMVWWRLI